MDADGLRPELDRALVKFGVACRYEDTAARQASAEEVRKAARAYAAEQVAAERERLDMLRAFVSDDAIACTYQSLGQYRSALLRAMRA